MKKLLVIAVLLVSGLTFGQDKESEYVDNINFTYLKNDNTNIISINIFSSIRYNWTDELGLIADITIRFVSGKELIIQGKPIDVKQFKDGDLYTAIFMLTPTQLKLFKNEEVESVSIGEISHDVMESELLQENANYVLN